MYDMMSIEGGIFMDPMNTIVAKNIKRLREEKKLSMEELSKLSSVSKSMLAQIERGEGNPTLSTLWKISNGMKVPFDALTVRPERIYEIVKTSEVQPLLEDSGKVKNYSIFPDDENRRFEGGIVIRVEGQTFPVEKGESIRFRADNPHSYRNTGAGKAVLHMILYNP